MQASQQTSATSGDILSEGQGASHALIAKLAIDVSTCKHTTLLLVKAELQSTCYNGVRSPSMRVGGI